MSNIVTYVEARAFSACLSLKLVYLLALFALWVGSVTAVAPNCAAQVDARGVAKNAFDNARIEEGSNQLLLAETDYEQVFDLPDSDNEFADIRAEAGLFAALVLIKEKKYDAALEWSNKVINMEGAPDSVKADSTRLEEKIEQLQQADENSASISSSTLMILGVGATILILLFSAGKRLVKHFR